jgi:hypothetical protein
MVTRSHTNLLKTQLSWRLIFYCGLRKYVYFEHLEEKNHGNKWKGEIFLRTNFWNIGFFEKNKFSVISIHRIWHQWTLFNGHLSKKSTSVALNKKCIEWYYLRHHRHYTRHVLSYVRKNKTSKRHQPLTWNVGTLYAWLFYSGMELIKYSDILFLLVQVDKVVKLLFAHYVQLMWQNEKWTKCPQA